MKYINSKNLFENNSLNIVLWKLDFITKYSQSFLRGVGQGLFAESAMIMCNGFDCIPCMQKTALSSVLVTPAQKWPFYELSPDTVQVLSLLPPHSKFWQKYRGWMGIDHFIGSTSPKLCVCCSISEQRNSLAKNTIQSVWVENCWLSKKDQLSDDTQDVGSSVVYT